MTEEIIIDRTSYPDGEFALLGQTPTRIRFIGNITCTVTDTGVSVHAYNLIKGIDETATLDLDAESAQAYTERFHTDDAFVQQLWNRVTSNHPIDI